MDSVSYYLVSNPGTFMNIWQMINTNFNLPEDGSPEDIMDHWICHMWLLCLMCLLAFWSYLIKVAVEYTGMSSSGSEDDI